MSLQLHNLQSNWISYLKRTSNYLSHKTSALLITDHSWKREMPLFNFKSKEYLQQWKVGSDADIGMMRMPITEYPSIILLPYSNLATISIRFTFLLILNFDRYLHKYRWILRSILGSYAAKHWYSSLTMFK